MPFPKATSWKNQDVQIDSHALNPSCPWSLCCMTPKCGASLDRVDSKVNGRLPRSREENSGKVSQDPGCTEPETAVGRGHQIRNLLSVK